MRQLTPKRLSAWLLTLIMLVGMLPAMASADEADDDPSPPAPQEDYGYVRLVFDEGGQLDLHHGEYITECSPTAGVHDDAGEDFIANGEYAALYYAGRLYHKAALDGVSINADAVLSAEDFALVPMGGLTTQTPPSSTEPEAPTTEGTTEGTTQGTTEGTNEETNGGTTEGTTQGTTEGTTQGTTGGTTEGTNEGTNGGTNEGTTEGTTEGTIGEQQLQQETLPPTTPVRKAPQLAAGDKYGYVSFQFRVSGEKAIQLHSGEYINVCVGNTVPTVWQATAEYPDIYDFIRDGDYKALHYQGFLYLKGELDLHGANINMDMVKLDFGISPKISVKDNASLYNSDSLIYSYDTGVEIFLPTGKKLELNAAFPGVQKYPGAIRVAGEATITGGGTLDITYTLINTESGTTPRTLFGIYGGEGVTLRGNKYDGTGPTVNIKMDSGAFGPEANDVVGIRSGGDLIIKGDSKVKIEMLGHKLGQTTTEEDVNRAITTKRLELLDNASLEILSHKNVIHDIVLTAESGDVLKVDTTGFLNIRNKGNIQRYDEGTWQHLKHDYPKNNIHLFKGSAQGARVNIIRAEKGVKIESFSVYINDWYKKLNDPEQGDWNWAISGGTDPELGTNMYRGNRRIDKLVQADSTTSIYTWGSMEYIYAPQGVATVKQSPGLTMGRDTPEGYSSSVGYAKVLEPKFNDIHVVRKGESVTLTAPGGKGTFLYWYDALRPLPSGSGTSWTNASQTFTNIRQDMVLVPVRDPMETGPSLSDVGYLAQWDSSLNANNRFAYQDLTFAKGAAFNNAGGGGYTALVPAQLPTYGEKTYAVKDLKGSHVMGLRNSRLFADGNVKGAGDEELAWKKIPTGNYRIAYYDDETGRCFISTPFKFDPPVAPPYIDPVTQIFEQSSKTVPVTIAAERSQPIKYRLWDYDKNNWGAYKDYKEPFDVEVTSAQDVRIKAYAGPTIKDITSEVRYALRPTGVPEVKYGNEVLSTTGANVPERYFYDSIELTVEVPEGYEGYEVWYDKTYAPYESGSTIHGIMVKDGKVTLNYGGEFNFKLAKVVTVGGQKYRSLSHSVTKIKLTKLETLPAPKVTVTTKEGNQTLIPDGSNTYTMTENVVTVTLESTMSWPLNATIAYDTNGNATPRLSKNYTTPFEVRGAGTLAVFTLVPKADGGYDYEGAAYTFKLAESLEWVPVSTYGGNCTASYRKEDGSWEGIFSYSKELKVGTRVKVTPNPPDGQVLKKWEIVNYDAYNIWGDYLTDEVYKPVLFFNVPKPQYSSYGSEPKTLSIKATFASAAEANISGQTLVGLDMSKTVGESISLWDTTKDMRTISCQWWVGDRAGTEDNALPGAVKFDPNKTYTVQVTIKANPGASFASSAGVAIGHYGGHFTVPNGKITRTGNDTLTFTATPIRQINLTMPAPLTVGDPLPTTADVEGLPAGVTVQALTWPGTSGNTVPEPVYDTVSAALTLKADGTHPILVGEYPPYPTVNGEEYVYASNSVTDGSKVTINIALPVKSKGVSVSGTAVSWNNTDNAEYRLYDGSTSDAAIKAEWKTGSYTGTACTSKGTPTASGKQFEQTFQFDTVTEGNYKLVIFKPGKYVPKIVPITVESTALDLGQLKLWLYGDVNYDGAVKTIDITMARQYFKGNLTLTDEQIAVMDMNGDGAIKVIDITILRQYFKGNISEIPIT